MFDLQGSPEKQKSNVSSFGQKSSYLIQPITENSEQYISDDDDDETDKLSLKLISIQKMKSKIKMISNLNHIPKTIIETEMMYSVGDISVGSKISQLNDEHSS